MRRYLLALNLLFSLSLFAQTDSAWQITELQPLPEAVSNNAVIQAQVNGEWYVYSFTGIGGNLTYSGIHLKAFKFDYGQNSWSALPDVPDTMGKIAAAASVVKGKIYIIGGYHVFANGDEISSDKVHVFDPQTDNYLPDGAAVPIPVDDQVQAVWRDSLIYVVGGWSNTAHTTAVQIYNPTTNTWAAGTPLPDDSDFKAFGASGVIIGDTIYYMGGARPGLNFPAAPELRKGVIDPNQPDSIVWSSQVIFGSIGYRMGAATLRGRPVWMGGSGISYNYNGFAYDGSGIVTPTRRIMIYDITTENLTIQDSVFVPVMDLRGVAEIGEGRYIVAGGITDNAMCTNKTWKVEYTWPTGLSQSEHYWEIQLYPNPATDKLYINSRSPITRYTVYNIQGRKMLDFEGHDKFHEVDLSNFKPGVYLLYLQDEQGRMMRRKVVLR